MRRKRWNWWAVALVSGAIVLGACSDDEEKADGSDGTEEADGSGGDDSADGGEGSGGGGITEAEGQAFLDGLIEGNGDEALSTCLAEAVRDEVLSGEITPDEVRAWTDGTGFDGPVQDFISQPDVVTACLTTSTTG